MFKNYTLVFCRRQLKNEETGEVSQQILLGMKKRGFGVNKLNGFGGKVEINETLRQAAVRELEEESYLRARSLVMRGLLLFEMQQSKMVMNVAVYECLEFDGVPTESDEMIPQWVDEDKIPFSSMWPDDKFWMPLFLTSHNFVGRFRYNSDDEIIDHTLMTTTATL